MLSIGWRGGSRSASSCVACVSHSLAFSSEQEGSAAWGRLGGGEPTLSIVARTWGGGERQVSVCASVSVGEAAGEQRVSSSSLGRRRSRSAREEASSSRETGRATDRLRRRSTGLFLLQEQLTGGRVAPLAEGIARAAGPGSDERVVVRVELGEGLHGRDAVAAELVEFGPSDAGNDAGLERGFSLSLPGGEPGVGVGDFCSKFRVANGRRELGLAVRDERARRAERLGEVFAAQRRVERRRKGNRALVETGRGPAEGEGAGDAVGQLLGFGRVEENELHSVDSRQGREHVAKGQRGGDRCSFELEVARGRVEVQDLFAAVSRRRARLARVPRDVDPDPLLLDSAQLRPELPRLAYHQMDLRAPRFHRLSDRRDFALDTSRGRQTADQDQSDVRSLALVVLADDGHPSYGLVALASGVPHHAHHRLMTRRGPF
mmetsp:Transcript_4835/g.14648  ORF Transcript_4835/g.14648 Transcript_4835/m.14648 type:complete len:433 (-) Transcript_4835:67-1365(-)